MKGKLLSVLLVLCSANTFAQEKSEYVGGYIGGTLGTAKAESDFDFDESGTSFGVVGGYHFTPYFGLEGTIYSADVSVSDVDAAVASFGVSPKFTIQLGHFASIYFKAGFASVALATDPEGGEEQTWAGVGFSYGAGVTFTATEHFHVRLGYDSVSADLEPDDNDYPEIDGDLSQFAVGAYYHF